MIKFAVSVVMVPLSTNRSTATAKSLARFARSTFDSGNISRHSYLYGAIPSVLEQSCR